MEDRHETAENDGEGYPFMWKFFGVCFVIMAIVAFISALFEEATSGTDAIWILLLGWGMVGWIIHVRILNDRQADKEFRDANKED